jgi:hypothetical protein
MIIPLEQEEVVEGNDDNEDEMINIDVNRGNNDRPNFMGMRMMFQPVLIEDDNYCEIKNLNDMTDDDEDDSRDDDHNWEDNSGRQVCRYDHACRDTQNSSFGLDGGLGQENIDTSNTITPRTTKRNGWCIPSVILK